MTKAEFIELTGEDPIDVLGGDFENILENNDVEVHSTILSEKLIEEDCALDDWLDKIDEHDV